MGTRARQFALLMLGQAACVAIGLWMQQRYVGWSAHREAEEQAWSAMESQAKSFLAEFDSLRLPASAPETQVFEQAMAGLEARSPGRRDVMIVDHDWRLVGGPGHDDANRAWGLSRGDRVSWDPVAGGAGSSMSPARGRLVMPDGPHLALACGLKGRRGHVLFHVPAADAMLSPAGLMGSLPIITSVTLMWICTLLGIIVYMILARFHDRAERVSAKAATDARRRAQALVRTRDAVIFGLAKLADSRDPETGDHLERITAYSKTLASALRGHPKFRDQIPLGFVKLIGISSALHDIGKVGIEDRILRKPGPLTTAEHLHVQTHTTIGGDCLRELERRLGGSNFLQMAREVALTHHERWDGKGYPAGLAGDAIPLSGRIVAVADVYDALSSKRVYSDAIPHAECVTIICREAGKQFDPDIVKVWLDIEKKFFSIAREYGDPVTDGVGGSRVEAENLREAEQDEERECLLPSLVSGESRR